MIRRWAALGAAMLAACGGGPDRIAGHVAGGEVWLAVGQEHAVAGTVLTLGFTDVPADSRCPSRVQCVWAGEATVTLGLRAGDRGPEHPVTLHTPAGSGPAVDTVLGVRLELLDLTPYPEDPGPIPRDRYRARVGLRVLP